jgi:hypothetical protein
MPKIVVAIPVRDEAALIGDCLRALALQQGGTQADILLLINNSLDGTAQIVRALRPVLPCRLHVFEHHFPAVERDAGHARRLAMAKAAMLTRSGDVVMATDADSCVSPDWLETNLTALQAGADVVCGRAIIDPLDALLIPQSLHDDDAQEVAYGTQLDRIQAMLDPEPHDPWPRHTEESGASIAIRRDVFMAAGGVPAVAQGEDRALLDALRRIDAHIRHDPDVTVTVSGRVIGRAAGGMADTIRRRMVQQDPMLDPTLEPVADRVLRIGARRLLRLAWGQNAGRRRVVRHLAAQLALPEVQLDGWLTLPYFGSVWALAEAASPRLGRRQVARGELNTQMVIANEVLASLASTGMSTDRAEP